MPLLIDDEGTAALVARLAEMRGSSETDAVRSAVQAELDRAEPLWEKFRRLRAEHPLPPPTGEVADKAFFDELSGDS